ncbi:hypothetical protein GQ457_03G030720 [Hibiscus cannabinus]
MQDYSSTELIVYSIEKGLETVRTELEETKYNLEKAREESMLMANSLCALKQELERRKRQVEQIEKLMMEDVKFKIVPGSARYEQGTQFQFANQPSFTR